MLAISTKYGRLANRLLLYAHVVAWAIEHKQTVANIALDEYAEEFENLRQDLFCRFPARRSLLPSGTRSRKILYAMRLIFGPGERLLYGQLRALLRDHQTAIGRNLGWLMKALRPVTRWFWSVAARRDWVHLLTLKEGERLELGQSLTELVNRTPLVMIEGWAFRNEELLIRHRERIRDFFAPVAPLRARVQNHVENARGACDFLVGVHMRQGDYRESRGGRFFFTPDQYAEVMRRMSENHRDAKIRFLVCSEEPPGPEVFDGLEVQLGPGDPVADMHALAECDFIFGPPSTFSRWASLIGNVPLHFLHEPGEEIRIDVPAPYARSEV
jgi:hypothetical protein